MYRTGWPQRKTRRYCGGCGLEDEERFLHSAPPVRADRGQDGVVCHLVTRF